MFVYIYIYSYSYSCLFIFIYITYLQYRWVASYLYHHSYSSIVQKFIHELYEYVWWFIFIIIIIVFCYHNPTSPPPSSSSLWRQPFVQLSVWRATRMAVLAHILLSLLLSLFTFTFTLMTTIVQLSVRRATRMAVLALFSRWHRRYHRRSVSIEYIIDGRSVIQRAWIPLKARITPKLIIYIHHGRGWDFVLVKNSSTFQLWFSLNLFLFPRVWTGPDSPAGKESSQEKNIFLRYWFDDHVEIYIFDWSEQSGIKTSKE